MWDMVVVLLSLGHPIFAIVVASAVVVGLDRVYTRVGGRLREGGSGAFYVRMEHENHHKM